MRNRSIIFIILIFLCVQIFATTLDEIFESGKINFNRNDEVTLSLKNIVQAFYKK